MKNTSYNYRLPKIAISIATLLALFPVFVNAETVLRTGADVSVESQQVVEGDYYVSVGPLGSTVMSGSIAEDMYAFGASVTVNGEVGADATFIAGSAQVYSPIGDDLRVLGGEVVIADTVAGDVFILAGSVSILSTASISGDVYVFGGSAVVEGDVAGSIYGHVEQLEVNGKVAGDVDVVAVAGVTLGDTAEILGNVLYSSVLDVQRSPNTVVEGQVQKKSQESQTTQDRIRDVMLPLFISLFTSLTVFLLFRTRLQDLLLSLENESGKSLLIGALTAIAGPFVAVVLIATILGMFVGVALLALLVFLYVVSFALTGVVFGFMLLRAFNPKTQLSLTTIIVGTLLLNSLLFIPIAGVFVLIVLECMTLGALSLMLYRAAT